MSPATPEVFGAIEELYQVFAAYPLPDSTDPCPCCHSDADERQIHAAPLRELSAEHLRNYVADALLVWGDAAVFKHFLPRIAEVFVTSSQVSLELQDPEMVFSRFRYGQWLGWPEAEQVAVRAFLYALWRAVLADPPLPGEFLDMESWLCSIAQAEDDLAPYLGTWLADDGIAAGVALGQFICDSGVIHRQETGRNAYWDRREEQWKQVRAWTYSEPVLKKLAAAERGTADDEGKGQIQAALSLLGVD